MEKLKSIVNAGQTPVMGYYLRFLALVFMGMSGFHFANLMGYAGSNLETMLPGARMLHIVYAQFFAVTAIGLWKLQPWGVACFFIATISQLVLYWGMPQYFTQIEEGEQAFQGIINIHISTIAVFCIIRIKRK